jgi:hypothetical protein
LYTAISDGKVLRVVSGTIYEFSALMKNRSNQNMVTSVDFMDKNFNLTGTESLVVPPDNTSVYYSRQITAPENSVYCRFVTYNDYNFSAFSGAIHVADIRLKEANSANMYIEDTIYAGAIQTNSLTSNQIAANAITVNELAAGAVTAAKIDVEELSAISAELGTITGGSIDIGSGKFQVASDGTVTIRNSSTGQRLVITNSLVEVYDASNVRRVRLGIW